MSETGSKRRMSPKSYTYRIGVLWLAWLMAILPCSSSSLPKVQDEEEYAVYSKVITELFAPKWVTAVCIGGRTFIRFSPHDIRDTLNRSSGRLSMISEWRDLLSDETLADYEVKNESRFQLKKGFKLTLAHSLFPDFEKPPSHCKWNTVMKMQLSRVGFNGKKNQALLYVEGRDSGGDLGYYVLLEKKNGSWAIRIYDLVRIVVV